MAWRVTKHRPRYLKSELVRTYAGESPDYYDVEKNKWFNTDAGSELVTNGDGTATAGWTNGTGATISTENGRLKLVTTTNTSAYQSLSLIAGKTYRIKGQVQGNGTLQAQVMINNETVITNNGTFYYADANSSSFDTTFVATENTTKIHLRFTGAGTGYFDSISIFPVDITPTTEIAESRNYMNHIVHADNDGGVLYVEELPKIEYKDSLQVNSLNVLSGFNLNQTWQNVTSSRVTGATYTNTTGKPIMVAIGIQNGTSGASRIGVDSVVLQYTGTSDYNIVTFIVPNLSTYKLFEATSISSWAELR